MCILCNSERQRGCAEDRELDERGGLLQRRGGVAVSGRDLADQTLRSEINTATLTLQACFLPRQPRIAPSTSYCCATLYHLLKVEYSMELAQRGDPRSSVSSRRFMGARTRGRALYCRSTAHPAPPRQFRGRCDAYQTRDSHIRKGSTFTGLERLAGERFLPELDSLNGHML